MDTTFVDGGISQANRIVAAWLNNVNNRVYRDAINVCSDPYGATTGATDNLVAIVAAVAAAKAAGRPVYVPGGQYNFSASFTLDGVIMFGDGDTSILHGTDATSTAVVLTGTGPAVRNLRFTGPTSATLGPASAAAVIAYQASEFRIENCSMETYRYPAIPVNGCTDGIISGNRLEDGWGGVFITNGIADTKRILVIGNTVRAMKDDSIAVVGGDAVITTQIEDVTVIGNTIFDQTTSGRGIVAFGVKRYKAIGNTIRNVTAAPGIIAGMDSTYSTQQTDDALFADNIVQGCGTGALSAVLLVGHATEISNNICFRNNIILNSGRAGVSSTGAGTPGLTKLSLIGNVIRSPTTNGLELDFVKDVSIIGNTFDTIPTSSIATGTSCSGSLTMNGNVSRDDNTSNGANVDWCTIAAGSFTDIVVNGNVRNGTNAIERGVENGIATAKLRGGGNAFNGATATFSTTLGGLLDGTTLGTFTCANNKDTTVANAMVTAGSKILLMPTNAAAGTLMGGVTSLYVATRTAGTSFKVTTANAAAAAGTETFEYVIFN